MKISFVIGGMTRGGAERVISILANHYANTGNDVEIIMLLNNECGYELDKRIKLINFTFKTFHVYNTFFWVKNIRSHFKKNKPDIIISFVARINILVLLSILLLKIPIIISERNDPSEDGRGYVTRILTQLLYRKANYIVFQTKKAFNCFSRVIQKKSFIISNPINVDEKAEMNSSKKIVSVGRLAEQKNHRLLLKAFKKFSISHPNYTLYIYGEGPLRDELKSLIIEKNMIDKVFLPGNIKNIHKNIKNAEFFVLSSNYEGQSNALLEAMCMGIPCISTDCAGSDEIINHMYNGILIPRGDEIALVNAMCRLADDYQLKFKISENASSLKANLSEKMIISKWDDLFQKLYDKEGMI